MGNQGTFNFRGAQPVTGDIDDIVHTTCDPIVAILIATRAVTRKVRSRKGLEVGVGKALVIPIHRAHLSGPAVEQHHIALASPLEDAPLIVDYGWLHAKKW